jgi:hypothetical protein
MQLNDPIAVIPAGGVMAAHVAPASVLSSKGAGPPVSDGPAVRQPTPWVHEIELTVAEAAGMATGFHVAPASVVVTSNAEAFELIWTCGFGPMAVQVVADEHDTDRRTPVPPLTSRKVHERPPSWLTRIWPPTATQNVVVGQSTEPSAATYGGSVGLAQVAPLSEDKRT